MERKRKHASKHPVGDEVTILRTNLPYTTLPLAALLIVAGNAFADWPTFGHDPQRTGWAREETKIKADNVGDLELKWSIKLENVSLALNALTSPVTARDVVTPSGVKNLVYVAGSSNHLFAIDADNGTLVWHRTFQSFVVAKTDSFFLCPNAINATPVIDRRQNLIFAIANDGRLFGLDLGTGLIRFGPFQFVPPFSKSWSLNLTNGFIYTTTSQGCGGDRSGLYSMRVDDPIHRTVYETAIASGSGAGMWSRGGTAIGQNGTVYVSTGDGSINPPVGNFGSSYLAASAPDVVIKDYFSPVNVEEVNKRDLDLPSGSLLSFPYEGYNLIAGGGKESVVYLLDADSLGNKDHQTPLAVSPQIGNKSKVLEEKGIWGAPAVWKDENNHPWIYVPLWGEALAELGQAAKMNGTAPHGSVVALKVQNDASGKPCLDVAWVSPDLNFPDVPVVANGVVFVVATGENPRQDKMLGKTDFRNEQEWKNNLLTTEERGAGTHPAELVALDAKTGKRLFGSGDAMKSWNHFGGLAIDNGRLFTTDHESVLYCFGLRSH